MLKILQILSQVPVPANDGGKLSVWGITKSLHNLGHKVFIVSYLQDKDYDKSLKIMQEYSTPYLLKVKTNYTYWGAIKSFFSKVPYNSLKFQRRELLRFIRKFFSENDVDIVQIEHLHMGWIVDEIRKLTKAPVILREQNLETNIMKRFYKKQRNPVLKVFAKLQYKKFIKFEPQMCSKFDKVVMISKTDEDELRKFNDAIDATTIPAGIDSQLFEYKKKDVIPYSLVHIGHTDWYPNFDGLNWFVEEIMPDLVKIDPKIKLYVYGGGNTVNYPVPIQLKKNIEVVGFVENLWENIADKALAIVPLRIGGGIRIKILELLATGTNIITTRVGKEGIPIQDGRHILVADTKENFVSMILDFFHGQYDSRMLSNNGRNFIKNNYGWDRISNKFVELYNKIL